jgi:hypothetical protein
MDLFYLFFHKDKNDKLNIQMIFSIANNQKKLKMKI